MGEYDWSPSDLTPMFEMKLASYSKVPPGNFRYKHPISGHEMNRHAWQLLLQDVRAHCAANGYPPVSDEEIELQMCQRFGDKIARQYCTGDGVSVRGVALGWQEIWNGTKVIASFIIGGRKVVEREEAERRAAICAPCSRNVLYAKPCGGDCPDLAATVSAIVGGEGTTLDHDLHACSVCACSNKAQVWVPIEHLKRGITPEMLEQFPAKCWKAEQLRALEG